MTSHDIEHLLAPGPGQTSRQARIVELRRQLAQEGSVDPGPAIGPDDDSRWAELHELERTEAKDAAERGVN